MGVYRRIVLISHLFPGITPFTVWDLPWHLWTQYAAAHDAYVAERKKTD